MTNSPAERSSRFIPIAAILLFFVGVQLWFLIMHGVGIRRYQSLLIGIAALAAAVTPAARAFASILERILHPSQRAMVIASIVIALISCLFFYAEAISQHRTFTPKYHDEFSYLLQTRMIAHGRLWEPALPIGQFFDSFQIITAPVYASIYFPGAAMLYAPSIWLHLPHWLIPLLMSGAITGMIFYVFTQMVDGIAGALGVVMFVSQPLVRLQTIMVMSNVPALLLAMSIFIVWLHWRRKPAAWLAVIIGALSGWLLITRPLDGIITILPILIASIPNLRGLGANRFFAACALAVIAASPFIALQLAFNHRVTGHLFETPFDFYADQTFPGTRYGFHSMSAAEPVSSLPQKRRYYNDVVRPLVQEHTPGGELIKWRDQYGENLFQWTLPHSLLIVLVPLGLLGLRDARRAAFIAMLPVFVALYFGYVFFLPHYLLLITPAMLMLVALGMDVVSNLSIKTRPQVLTFFVCAIVLLCVSEWPQFNRLAMDEWLVPPEEAAIDSQLAALQKDQRAIVLFHFGPHSDSGFEPVYNTQWLWPDDARIIRAHDLGNRDIELFRYYAAHQPDRAIYRYDRDTNLMTYLGTAIQLK